MAAALVVVTAVVLSLGALGHIREPRNPVPQDLRRYVQDIEHEFEGFEPSRVLLDNGSWIYLREGVLMKDRSSPVALHAGANQRSINHEMLTATIGRIENQDYDKILATGLHTKESAYDFQDRGSGVKDAILANYVEVNRIPAVEGVKQWWPQLLLNEIPVYVPLGNRAHEER